MQLEKHLCLYPVHPCQRRICDCVNQFKEKYSSRGSTVPEKEYDRYRYCRSETLRYDKCFKHKAQQVLQNTD